MELVVSSLRDSCFFPSLSQDLRPGLMNHAASRLDSRWRLSPHRSLSSRFAACGTLGVYILPNIPRAPQDGAPSVYSISNLIFAVFSSIAETEQYFSFERRTASSMALWETLPPTRYFNFISVKTAG